MNMQVILMKCQEDVNYNSVLKRHKFTVNYSYFEVHCELPKHAAQIQSVFPVMFPGTCKVMLKNSLQASVGCVHFDRDLLTFPGCGWTL